MPNVEGRSERNPSEIPPPHRRSRHARGVGSGGVVGGLDGSELMTTKHTHGPWRHEPYEGSHESAVIGECHQIATVSYDDFEHSNARLIAAAPDLLAACEASKPFLNYLANVGNADADEICLLLKAAIGKARGEADA